MNEGAPKEFLKLDIYCADTTTIYHNSGSHNVTVPVPQVGSSPSFAGVNFIYPPITPTMPHINHASLGCRQN